jgi:ADP-ribose pyrophosphatase YjhB (NUDIX family)
VTRIEIPRHCESCGAGLKNAPADDPFGAPFICSACGRRIYLDPKTAVATVVEYGGKVLLLKRAQNDVAHGKWILPGGHVDRGEVVEKAAMREVLEETGLLIELKGLLGVYSYQDNPIILMAYWGVAKGGELFTSNEALEVKSFSPHKLPWDHMGYQSTHDALKDYLAINAKA